METDLKNSENLAPMLDNLIGGICVLDYNSETHEYQFDYLNDGFFRMIGTTRTEAARFLSNVRLMILPQDLPIIQQGLRDIIADNGSIEFAFRYVSLDGALAYLRLRGNLYERSGNVHRIICMLSDCTEEKLIDEEMRKQYDFINSVIETAGSFDFNVRTDVMTLRPGDGRGGMMGDIVIQNYLDHIDEFNIHPDDRDFFIESIESAKLSPRKDSVEFRMGGSKYFGRISNPADYRWYRCNLMGLLGQEGYISHILGLIVDIQEQKLEELSLKLRADRDPLTGLLNRGATESLIREAVLEYRDGDQGYGALFMIDVDDFKKINDGFGHAVGDAVLRYVGDALSQNFKGKDVVGRIGGDEFMVFLQHFRNREDPVRIAEMLQKNVRNGFPDPAVAEKMSISIGIALCPADAPDYDSLYRKADAALYVTKENGKAGHSVYRIDMGG